MNVLSRGIEALAAMAQNTRGVRFSVEVEEEGPISNSKTSMEYIKRVL